MAQDAKKVVTVSKAGFGPVELSRPANVTVFPGRNGQRSCVVLNAKVPLIGLGLTIEAAIWARANADGVTFSASLPKRMTADDTDSEDAFAAHVETAAMQWEGWKDAAATAYARVTGTQVKTAKAPRLVFKPENERPANMPTSTTASGQTQTA